jgi:PTH2 family peptidyl-tRNA hydrolase
MKAIKGKIKQVILVRKDLKMGAGKAAAQASHASLLGYLETVGEYPEIAETWLFEGQTKIILKIKDEKEASEIKKKLRAAKIPFKAVKDAGQTQVPPGTETAIGIGPYYEKEIDKITGELPLF